MSFVEPHTDSQIFTLAVTRHVHLFLRPSLKRGETPVGVNGDWPCQWEMAIFDPTESTLLNRSPKNWYKWLRRRLLRLSNLVQIRPWANGRNITNFFSLKSHTCVLRERVYFPHSNNTWISTQQKCKIRRVARKALDPSKLATHCNNLL